MKLFEVSSTKSEYVIWGTKNGVEDIVRINGAEAQSNLKNTEKIVSILKVRGEFDKIRIQKIMYGDWDIKEEFVGGVKKEYLR